MSARGRAKGERIVEYGGSAGAKGAGNNITIHLPVYVKTLGGIHTG